MNNKYQVWEEQRKRGYIGSFYCQKLNLYEFLQCSKKVCLSLLMINLVNIAMALLDSGFNVTLFEPKNKLFEFDYQNMSTFEFVWCSKNGVPPITIKIKLKFWSFFQICKEEQENQAKLIEKEVKAAVAKVTASYEERLSSIRAENSLKIQQGKSLLLIRNLVVVSSVSFFWRAIQLCHQLVCKWV